MHDYVRIMRSYNSYQSVHRLEERVENFRQSKSRKRDRECKDQGELDSPQK